MTYSAYGMQESQVLACLNRYPFGALMEIIEQIDFYKGIYTFTFKKPDGYASWKQWLYLNEQYPTLSDLLKALHKADDMDPYHDFQDQHGKVFARTDDEQPWKVEYIKN